MMTISSHQSVASDQPPADDENRQIPLDTEASKQALRNCFLSALRTDRVIQVFGPYVASHDRELLKQTEICTKRFRDYYQSLNDTEQRTEAMDHFAEYVYSLTSPRYIKIIFTIILNLVKEGAFMEADLETFCRRLLVSNELTLKKPHHWCHVFNLIDHVVQFVNYKVCQHLFINTLYKMHEVIQQNPYSSIRNAFE